MKSLKHLLTVALIIFTLPSLQAEQPNLLPNGDFKKGMEGWLASISGEAEGEVKITEDGPNEGDLALQVSVTSAGENYGDVGVQLTDFAVEAGKTYILKFTAKSEPSAYLVFIAIGDEGQGTIGQQKTIKIQEEWNEYSYEFDAKASASKVRIKIGKMNRSDSTFWFANASLKIVE